MTTETLERPSQVATIVTGQKPALGAPAKGTKKVLLIGGLFSAETQWNSLIRTSRGLPLEFYLPDRLPAHDGVTIKNRIDQIASEIEAKNERVVIVTHSLGTFIGAAVAHRLPKRVSSFVAISPAPPFGIEFADSVKQRMGRAEYVEAMQTGKTVSIHPDDVAFLRDGSTADFGPESGAIMAELAMGIKDAVPLSLLQCPVILINGENDGVLTPGVCEQIAKYHGFKVELTAGGHFSHCDPRVSPEFWKTKMQVIHSFD